jgi:MFS family permease
VSERGILAVDAAHARDEALDRRARRRALTVFGVDLGLLAVGWTFLALNSAAGSDSLGGGLSFDIPTLVFPLTGVLVARRQPRNAVTWVLLGIGLASAIGAVLTGYSTYALATNPGSLPAGAQLATIGAAMWVPIVVPVATLLLLLFPDGRPPSRRWGAFLWLTVFAMAAVFLAIVVSPGDVSNDQHLKIANPFAVPELRFLTKLLFVGLPLVPVCMVASAASLIVRFRRSRGVERLQLKWLATAAAVSASIYAVALLDGLGSALGFAKSPAWSGVVDSIALFSLLLIPISIGLAILRYRLFDIDRLISRTIAYSLLTAILVGVYALIVVGVGTATGRSDNPVLIAGATLAVAALFRPARRRIQAVIDRRLYRRRYDAERVLGTFASRLRDELDLTTLSGELQAVVAQAVQPSLVGVWIRQSGGRS